MGKKLTGRDGVLRIFDSSAILLGTAPRDDATPDMITWDGSTTWANITSDVEADDAAFASAFLADNEDAVFIGADKMFAMIRYLKDAGTNYAAGSGILKAYYFDGTDFSKELTGVLDVTLSGGDCFAQDGYISFKIPVDWAIGANAINAALDADKHYIKLMTTTSPTTDPDADVLCPCDGQYFEIAFANMDFNAPLGRPKPDEILNLDRNKMNSRAHYIKGSDDKVLKTIPLTFSCAIDDTYNKDDIMNALACGNPSSARWTAAGVSTKGDTKNDGINANPAFADATKKTVNIMVLFAGESTNEGRAYYEMFFPDDEQALAEAEDAITLTCNGGCFGVIERIFGFGNRY